MVEFLPSKQNVAGSSPVIRSKPDRLTPIACGIGLCIRQAA